MPLSILVVDDEPDMQSLVKQRFRKEIRDDGWKVDFYPNGIEALDFLRGDNEVDVVLSDINMPGMDGLTLIKKISELEKEYKTIVVTAYSDLSNIRVAMNNGAYDFITKPIDFQDLKATIEKAGKDALELKSAKKAKKDLDFIHDELDSARQIQQQVLNDQFPVHASLKGAAYMRPAKEVGGDFYDFFLSDQEVLSVTIGDVAGKGISAALYMAICTTLMQGVVQESKNPADSVQMLNRLLYPRSLAKMFVTVLSGIVDLSTGRIEYCNAGHFPPIVLKANGEIVELRDSKGPAVSMLADFKFVAGESFLEKNDTVLFYTDGITEAKNSDREEFMDDRLHQLLSSHVSSTPEELLQAIVEAVDSFSGDVEQADDMTLLAFKYLGTSHLDQV